MSKEPDQRLPDELHEHVETFSLIFEAFGFQRMGGRMFALMLLSNEEMFTQAQLAAELNASTGSVSTMIRLLDARSQLTSDHYTNYLNLEGRLPGCRNRLLAQIDDALKRPETEFRPFFVGDQ